MKRTNLVLDEQMLKEAVKVLGTKTYSEAVNTALTEIVRIRKMQDILRFAGSGLWEGDLAEMREDRPRRRRRRAK